ncbi:DNA repair protein RadA [candidate division WWE3 bacterium]|uniref:DNA repair protein RadA n=1 Tax=candidate division WWE3 bacterium TaxID=2053526 RepID=A0A955LHG4_UNCKA|nr:DNA repair protein RadA [candidate division WWE3 bacterium]
MTKNKSQQFVCSACGNVSSRWSGKCFACGEWNTLKEYHAPVAAFDENTGTKLDLAALASISKTTVSRIETEFSAVDRVLGGGLVPGSVILLGGEPGTGKSTILLQYADAIANGHTVVYLSAEESREQVSLRAHRLGLAHSENILISNIETIDDLFVSIEDSEKPTLVILDSVQTIRDTAINSRTGSVGHVQSIAQKVVDFAKKTNISVILVGHVTKEGSLAGPKTLEHLVDVVLYLEGDTEKKVLRAAKNRFGSVNELALLNFENGYFEETKPGFALGESAEDETHIGAVTTVVKEGGRYVPLEIQALVVQSYQQQPRRVVNGYDYNRLLLLLAILDKHTNHKFYRHDVFVNVSEGIKIYETAADLAVCVALVSSLRKVPIPRNLGVWGEVSLLGKVSPVGHQDQRKKEAERYTIVQFLTPEESGTIRSALQELKKLTSQTI